MKLSMSILCEYLKSFSPEAHIVRDTMSIRGVRFLSDQMQPSSLDYVYIGQARVFFQDPKLENAIILANGRNHMICHNADYEELLNTVLSAFEYYNSLEQQLSRLSLSHSSLQELLAAAGALLPDPLIVFDMNGKMMGASHMEHFHDRELAAALHQSGGISSQILGTSFADRDGVVSHDLSGSPQYLHPQGGSWPGAISMYLLQENERVGFMMYFPASENQVEMGMTVEKWLADYISQAEVFSDSRSLHQANHSIFRSLLRGRALPREVLSKLEKYLGESISYSLLLFKSLAIRNRVMNSLVIHDVERAGVQAIAAENDDMAAILVSSASLTPLLHSLQDGLRGKNYVIGVSAPFASLEETAGAFSQARFAVNAFSETSSSQIIYFRALALSYILENLRRDDVMTVLHPAISILGKYDADNHTSLLETVRMYEKCLMNQADTAKALHIHLNTLKYRLKRIEELTDIHFQDPQEVLYLCLSLALQPAAREAGRA